MSKLTIAKAKKIEHPYYRRVVVYKEACPFCSALLHLDPLETDRSDNTIYRCDCGMWEHEAPHLNGGFWFYKSKDQRQKNG